MLQGKWGLCVGSKNSPVDTLCRETQHLYPLLGDVSWSRSDVLSLTPLCYWDFDLIYIQSSDALKTLDQFVIFPFLFFPL